jgi:hypothetical protein
MSYADLDQSYASNMRNVNFGEYEMYGLRSDEDIFAEFYIHGGKAITDSKWKVHVSIGAPQLQKGWDIVYPLLVARRIHHFKVTRQSAMRAKANRIASGRQLTAVEINQGIADLGRLSLGMQITIYVPQGGEVKVQDVLKKIEKRLSDAKVMEGEINKSDRPIGKYCSVRNDGGACGYQSHDKVNGYNPSGDPDPFPQKL